MRASVTPAMGVLRGSWHSPAAGADPVHCVPPMFAEGTRSAASRKLVPGCAVSSSHSYGVVQPPFRLVHRADAWLHNME